MFNGILNKHQANLDIFLVKEIAFGKSVMENFKIYIISNKVLIKSFLTEVLII